MLGQKIKIGVTQPEKNQMLANGLKQKGVRGFEVVGTRCWNFGKNDNK